MSVGEYCKFPTEEIPDTDGLLTRVSTKAFVRNGKLQIGFFRNHPNPDNRPPSMSSDWERYSTAERTRASVRPGVSPLDYGIIRLGVGEVRTIPLQLIEHTPEDDNQAHADVFGDKKDEQVRQGFYDIAKWVPGFEPET